MFYLLNYYHHREKMYLVQDLILITHQYLYISFLFVFLPAKTFSKMVSASVFSDWFDMFFVDLTIFASSIRKVPFMLNLPS